MAVFSAQPVIEIAPEFAAERAPKVAPATLLDLIVARVRMALQSEAGPARSALEARLAGPDGAARSERWRPRRLERRRPRRRMGGLRGRCCQRNLGLAVRRRDAAGPAGEDASAPSR